jgi:hypothetical protein
MICGRGGGRGGIFLSSFLHFEQVLQTCHHLMLNPSLLVCDTTLKFEKKQTLLLLHQNIGLHIYSLCVCVCKCICFTLALQQFYMGSKGFT